MYNKNMIKRASSDDAPVSKGISKIAMGFTIIETMLFLAIAGLIFVGLVAGTNGAIRQQRYKDSVQGFVDDLRDLYSLAENTQVLDYPGTPICGGTSTSKTGRGRSACSVYGIFAKIVPTSMSSNNVQAFWVTGIDQASLDSYSSDIEFLENAQVRTVTVTTEGNTTLTALEHGVLWGADVVVPCSYISAEFGSLYDNGCSAGDAVPKKKYPVALFIYRSPITGSINTLTYTMSETDYLNPDYLYTRLGDFDHEDAQFCITTGAGMSEGNGLRMVKVDGNGSNTNSVRLIESESPENKCNK